MKRSEMLKRVCEKFEEFSTNQQYRGYSNEGLTEVFLDLFLNEGMLPPEAADFNIGNNWEPEKWAVEYKCSKQLNGINTSEVIHDEAATLTWEKLLTAKEELSNIE